MKTWMAILLVTIVTLIVGIGCWALTAWIVVGLLHWLGIYTIGSWTVAFSWKLVLVLAILSGICGGGSVARKN